METVLNLFQMNALLMDTITHLKFKMHLHRNFKCAKAAFCKAKGIKPNVSSFTLLCHLGKVYEENGKLQYFTDTCKKLNYEITIG